MKYCLFFMIVLFSITFPGGGIQAREVDRINAAIEVLYDLTQIPERRVFFNLLEDSEGVAVFPRVYRLGIMLGLQYGEGLVMRRDPETKSWYGPSFARIYGVSYGPQMGIQTSRLVLLIMDQAGMEVFYEDGIKLGGNVSIAAGPVGRSLSAEVDLALRSSIYSYSISRGLFIGISLEGAQLREDRDANHRYFGYNLSPQDILTGRHPVEPAAQNLARFLEELATGQRR
ncbi:MAG TPA: lipid-binding SYLF domain-containing protein [Atribacteraceae bacterium]|nr:lipid-binding SYLF domain-containing protein [Atribacteraceae bacterium]